MGIYYSQIDKAYPRDFMQVGRVRVQLKREDGTFVNPAIASSKTSSLHSFVISFELRFCVYLTTNHKVVFIDSHGICFSFS